MLGTLEPSFHTEDLLHLCTDESISEQALGVRAAEALRNRLDDIRAAESVYDLLAGQPQPGKHNGADCYRLHLGDDIWLTAVPGHVTPRVDGAGNADWGRVRRLRIVAVGRLEWLR